jgi:hypothetical protein
MPKISVGGSIGDLTSVSGDGNNVSIEKQQGDPSGNKRLLLAIVAVALIIGLAWGANHFIFSGMGVTGESVPATEHSQ